MKILISLHSPCLLGSRKAAATEYWGTDKLILELHRSQMYNRIFVWNNYKSNIAPTHIPKFILNSRCNLSSILEVEEGAEINLLNTFRD